MTKAKSAESYIKNHPKWSEELGILRKVLIDSELDETVKWGMPVYTLGGKNVIGITGFKHHFGVWFYQGVFLYDPHKLLRNAQEGKTKAMRHLNFKDKSEIDLAILKEYVAEAIENQKSGKVVKASSRSSKLPELLKAALSADAELKAGFEGLTPGKQKDYIEYISEAKMEKTKLKRLDKIVPMILRGEGLNDRNSAGLVRIAMEHNLLD